MAKSSFMPHIFWLNVFKKIWSTRRFICLVFFLMAALHFLAFLLSENIAEQSFSKILGFLSANHNLSELYSHWVNSLGWTSLFFAIDGLLQIYLIFLLLLKFEEYHRACEESGLAALSLKGFYWTFVRSGLLGFLLCVFLGVFIYMNAGPLMIVGFPLLLVPALMVQTPTSAMRAIYQTLSFRFLGKSTSDFFAVMVCLMSIAAALYAGERSLGLSMDFFSEWIFDISLNKPLPRFASVLGLKWPSVVLELIQYCMEFSSVVIFSASTSALVASIENEKARLPKGGIVT